VLNANPALKAVHDNVDSIGDLKLMLTNWVVQETDGPKNYVNDEFGRGRSIAVINLVLLPKF